jgi:CubicO group peptidase (beta-lactamase class C family)
MRGEIERLVDQAGSRGHDALVAGVLAKGGPIVHGWRRDGHGLDERALFEIGSITKPFTGVLLTDMSLRGEVRLEDPVSMYLKDTPVPRWNTREPTLEELATHRAALPNAPRGLVWKELAFVFGLRSSDPWADLEPGAYREAMRRTAARRPPGGRFRYSSLGFGLLGDALAARAGTPLRAPARGKDPLASGTARHHDLGAAGETGASSRGPFAARCPRPPLRDEMPAAGAIRATACDLLLFLACSLAPPEGAPGPALRLATETRAGVGRKTSASAG